MSFHGRRDDVGIKKDAVRLTAETTAAKWLPYTSFDLQKKYEFFKDDSAFGRREALLDTTIAKEWVEGGMEGKLDPETFGDILFYFFGTDTPVTALGATTHVFSVNQTSLLPTFTAFYENSAMGWLCSRATTISELEISAEEGSDAVKWSTKMLGLAENAPSSQTPAYTEPTKILLPKHPIAKFAPLVVGLNAGTVLDLKSFKLSMKNNSEVNFDLGSQLGTDIYSKNVEGELSITCVVKTSTFDALFRAGTAQALQIFIENTQAAVLGTSALKPALKIEVPPSLIDITYKKDINGITTFDATIPLEYSFTNSFAVRVSLQNLVATY
jgi:hypothetical protein